MFRQIKIKHRLSRELILKNVYILFKGSIYSFSDQIISNYDFKWFFYVKNLLINWIWKIFILSNMFYFFRFSCWRSELNENFKNVFGFGLNCLKKSLLVIIWHNIYFNSDRRVEKFLFTLQMVSNAKGNIPLVRVIVFPTSRL